MPKLDKQFVPAMDGERLSEYLGDIVDRVNLLSELIMQLFDRSIPPSFRSDERYKDFEKLRKQLE